MAMLGSSVIYHFVYSSDSSILQKRADKKQHPMTKNLLKHLKICNNCRKSSIGQFHAFTSQYLINSIRKQHLRYKFYNTNS